MSGNLHPKIDKIIRFLPLSILVASATVTLLLVLVFKLPVSYMYGVACFLIFFFAALSLVAALFVLVIFYIYFRIKHVETADFTIFRRRIISLILKLLGISIVAFVTGFLAALTSGCVGCSA